MIGRLLLERIHKWFGWRIVIAFVGVAFLANQSEIGPFNNLLGTATHGIDVIGFPEGNRRFAINALIERFLPKGSFDVWVAIAKLDRISHFDRIAFGFQIFLCPFRSF
nr:hypothetical protein [Zavarzinella formosa]